MYSDICVFHSKGSGGLFKELDILAMTDDFFRAWEPLINPDMGMSLLDFFERFEATGLAKSDEFVAKRLTIKVNRMKELLLPKITSMTIHIRLQESRVLDTIKAQSLNTLHSKTTEERQKLRSVLKEVLQYEDVWRYKILPRSAEDYKRFKTECSKLEMLANALNFGFIQRGMRLERTDDLMKRIKMKDNGFYDSKEKETSTRMSSFGGPNLIAMKEMLEGLDFVDEVKRKSIPLHSYRKVKFRRDD